MKTKIQNETKEVAKTGFKFAIPEDLAIPPDPLRLRLDFYHQSTILTDFEAETVSTRMVSAMDVAMALANELSVNTGLLPDNTLWWRNTRTGPVYALYEGPKIRKLALQMDINKPAERFSVPMPPFIFLVIAGRAPWVFACRKKPTKETDIVYKAPLFNVHQNGLSCPGSHHYPTRVADVVESFFMSFFTNTADTVNRSVKYKDSVLHIWRALNGKKTYPLEDLKEHGTIADLLQMEM